MTCLLITSFSLLLRLTLGATGVFLLTPPPRKGGMELSISWGKLNSSYGSGELQRVEDGEPSGLLHGVAVGEKLFIPQGVLKADGVTALIPAMK